MENKKKTLKKTENLINNYLYSMHFDTEEKQSRLTKKLKQKYEKLSKSQLQQLSKEMNDLMKTEELVNTKYKENKLQKKKLDLKTIEFRNSIAEIFEENKNKEQEGEYIDLEDEENFKVFESFMEEFGDDFFKNAEDKNFFQDSNAEEITSGLMDIAFKLIGQNNPIKTKTKNKKVKEIEASESIKILNEIQTPDLSEDDKELFLNLNFESKEIIFY
jgi:hypothetical protein